MTEFCAYLRELIARRRRHRRGDDDLLTRLLGDDQLTETELAQNCVFLLNAGHETTTNLIGNGMLALLQHPDQLQRLQADPSLISGAVEEFLRRDGPVQFTHRIALEDVTIGGKTIRKGQELTYHYNTDGEGLIPCRCRPGCQTLL